MTYRTSRRRQVLDAFRAHVEAVGESPTAGELGAATGMSGVGAWKHVQALVGDGALVKKGRKYLLPERIDLAPVPTDRLRGELARRGVTLDALAVPKLLMNQGRPCAAYGCDERVGRGMLMCRAHWFALPINLRRAITGAFSARHTQAYQEAVEAARDHLGGFTLIAERVE